LRKEPKGVKNWDGPYLAKDLPLDPWDNPYHYKAPGKDNPYALYTLGKDGTEGGEDEDLDQGTF
jgi:general secretion pathway protein G